jgi:hypothetical protein
LVAGDAEAVECQGTLAAHIVRMGVRAAPDADRRIAAGEDFFAVPRGGRVDIFRNLLGPDDPPAIRSDIPASHWYAGTVAGLPAAIGRPVVDGGIGTAAVIVFDDDTNVLTSVYTYNLSLAAALALAEEVVK